MSDPFKNPNRFRELLREAVQVTVTSDDGKVIRRQKVKDDDIDELLWAVDKYSWGEIGTTYRKVGGKRLKTLNRKSEELVKTVVEQLVSPQEVDRLIEVITPWEQQGFDALRRLLASQEQLGKRFPFFMFTLPPPATNSASAKIVEWPAEPSAKSVDYVYNTTSYGRGRGELLLCLMTGGIRSGKEGDFVTPDGKKWEVKQPEGKHHQARLGDKTSKKFRETLKEKLATLRLPPEYEKLLFHKLSSQELQKSVMDHVMDAVHKSLEEAIADEDLSGFLFVSSEGVKAFSPVSVQFHSLLPSGRVEITIRP